MRIGSLVKTVGQEGKEKHLPVIELHDCPECGGTMVRITVGKETPHPNTIEHHIKWILLFGVKGGLAVHVATFDLGPTYGHPKVAAHVETQGFSELIAVEYCNIHGLWENSLAL
jgi:superoxide reductase